MTDLEHVTARPPAAHERPLPRHHLRTTDDLPAEARGPRMARPAPARRPGTGTGAEPPTPVVRLRRPSAVGPTIAGGLAALGLGLHALPGMVTDTFALRGAPVGALQAAGTTCMWAALAVTAVAVVHRAAMWLHDRRRRPAT